MFEKIKEILCENFDVDADMLEPSLRLEYDLGLDSLDVAEFLMCLEDKFDILLDKEECYDVKTVADVVKAVENSL